MTMTMNRILARVLRRNDGDNEQGIALAAVVGIAAILMVISVTAVTFSVGASTKAKTDNDSTDAIAAAYAGVSDYQARLTNDNTYIKYGDPSAPFSAATGSANLSLPVTSPNPAFGWGKTGTWQPVPGASGNIAFRYEVDSSQYSNQGVVRLRATGRSGNVTRTVVANVRQKGFIDYLYFTDYESIDPAITGADATACQKYYPSRNEAAVSSGGCGPAIQFAAGDTVNGPLHSNDAIMDCGATFNGPVSTFYSGNPLYRTCGGAQTFAQGITHSDKLQMPPTNAALRQETRGDLTATTVPRPGCLYTGPTSIIFNGDGTMTVRSPWTKFVNTGVNAGGVAYGMNNLACGTPGTGGLGSATGQTFAVPVQNLIFVQNVPSTTDPNFWTTNTTPTGFTCPSGGNGLGYPVAPMSTSSGTGNSAKTVTTNEVLSGSSASAASGSYGCSAGDAFVGSSASNGVKGQVTIAAENFVWITSDLRYTNSNTDVLGLIGQNAVWVWNPYMKTSCAGNGCGPGYPTYSSYLNLSGREINAAILSLSHTFQVQNYDSGQTQGTLTVLGAIAQEWRGTVATSFNGVIRTGFLKSYNYDARFRSIAPPKFLQAVSTTYGISQFSEVKPTFAADGTTQ